MTVNYLIIAVCLLLGIFLVYKEFVREEKGWLVWRITASIIAVASFACLALPLSYTATRTGRVNEIVLISQGADRDSLRSLKNTILYTADSLALTENKSLNVTYIPDLPYFLETNPTINSLRVLGYGLSRRQLDPLKSYNLTFHFPADNPSGIIECSWNSHLRVSEPLVLQGLYNNSSSNPVNLLLKGLGTTLDSVLIAPGKSSRFSLKATPRQLGKAVYEIIALTGNDTLKREKIPFEVLEARKLQILMLSSAPEFEYKFLKNWLFEHNYPLSIRTTVSKNKYSTDYLNMESNDLSRISQTLLKKFDIIIADETELAALSPVEKSAIYTGIEQGSGLIIRMNAGKSVSSFSGFFSFYSVSNNPLVVPGFSGEPALKPLSFEQTLYIKPADGQAPIVNDQNSRVLVSSKLHGMGKLVASAIPSTYNWMLSGNDKEYTEFWSKLIRLATKPEKLPESWSVTPSFPVVRNQTMISLETAQTSAAPTISVNNRNLSLLQNTELPFLWSGTFWADHSGWNSTSIMGKSSSIYVYEKNSWKDALNYKKLQASRQYAINKDQKPGENQERTDKFEKNIPKWLFFLIFLASISFLWAELRYLNNK